VKSKAKKTKMPAHRQQKEESIYNLIPKEKVVIEKQPR
jgi:hypothetical protein